MNLRQLIERGERPFAPQPLASRYFPAAAAEDARRRLGRAIERGDGPGVVVGAAGSGKSLLLQVLAAQYRERFDVVLLACAQLCTRRALLQAIHFELGLDYRRRDEGQLRLSLLDQLLAAEETEGLLLLVDEAQSLAPHLLEELRLLTNLACGGLPRVRLVLAGLPALEDKLTSPELEAFSQRVSARCYLAPFSREETCQYIRAQLQASSLDAPQVFAAAAMDAVFHATDGVPRLVNQLCDRSLLWAADHQSSQVDSTIVQAAWADLQQLPTPWDTRAEGSAANSAEGVVEFGSLASEAPLPAHGATEPAQEPRPVLEPEVPAFTFDTVRLADRIATMPLINAESDADEPVEPTELDDAEPIAHEAAPARAVTNAKLGLRIADWRAGSSSTPITGAEDRPARSKSSAEIPPAADPFADAFDEEEIVLASFASLAGIIGPQTPRVENRREPDFARRVQQALEAAEFVIGDDRPKGATLPPIRLAVVPEPHAADPVLSTESDHGALAEDAEPILIIEDDAEAQPARASTGVRRENYRNLFTRLRHGA